MAKGDAISNYPFLTYDEFVASITSFVQQYPDWTISRRQGQQFLTHTQALGIHPPQPSQHSSDPSTIEDADPAWDGHISSPRSSYIEYHAVFSATWQVPVLYLRVFEGGEHVMEIDKVKRLVVRDAGIRAAMDAVAFGGALGMQDHPLLNVPFLYLHPCHTATLMRTVADAGRGIVVGSGAYMAAWLSLSGQAAGVVLRTPSQ